MKNQNNGVGSIVVWTKARKQPVTFLLLTAIFCLINSSSLLAQTQTAAKYSSSLPDPSLEKTVRNTLKKNCSELQLVENNGQSGLTSSVVAYFTSANEMVFVEKDRLRILVAEQTGKNKEQKTPNDKSLIGEQQSKRFHYNSFEIVFKGSKGFTSMEKISPFVTQRNFIHLEKGMADSKQAASYGEIILKNVYDGIDLRLYSQENGQLEFDWIIWPGAHAELVKLEFKGQKKLLLSATGNLQVQLAMGNFNMRLPESYYVTPQGKKKVQVRFAKQGNNTVHFTGWGQQDKKYPLVIDPDLLWGTFFDGGNTNFDEYLYSIQFNYNNDLIYCAGAASMQVSTAYAAAFSDSYDSTFAATPDALVYAVTKDGQFVKYITYLGGTAADVGIGISVSTNFIYLCGYTASIDFPVTLLADTLYPAFDSVYRTGDDGFVAIFNLKLDTLHYCSYIGGKGTDKALTIRAVADSVYYVSLASTDTLPVASPNYIVEYADSIFSGNSEAWIGKFSSFNVLNFGTYIGGNNDDLVNDFQVLSNGDIVFTGNTRNITEINGTIPNNTSGQEALYGRIHVPASGPVSFDILDKFGGSNNDYGWGIYSLGDSVSIVVGQTNSSNFPIGPDPVFQSTRDGQIDGFIAKIYNDGSPGYKATFTGGSDDDILVGVRPVVVNNTVALLAWGTTASNDLITRNFNSGTFYSNLNAGGLDMMFVICDMNFFTKYYLSYVGGSSNDYLGITGAPVGSNHLFYNDADSVLYLGTTTHSSQTTHSPLFVGRGPADVFNSGVPVFDQTKNNSNNDTHVIIAISTRGLFAVLPLCWEMIKAELLPDCSTMLSWKTSNEEKLRHYTIERSSDGINFSAIGSVSRQNGDYTFTDRTVTAVADKIYYRVAAVDIDGHITYSSTQLLRTCNSKNGSLTVYPTVIQQTFNITGEYPAVVKEVTVQVIDVNGKKLFETQRQALTGTQSFVLDKNPAAGSCFVVVRDTETGNLLLTKKILIRN